MPYQRPGGPKPTKHQENSVKTDRNNPPFGPGPGSGPWGGVSVCFDLVFLVFCLFWSPEALIWHTRVRLLRPPEQLVRYLLGTKTTGNPDTWYLLLGSWLPGTRYSFSGGIPFFKFLDTFVMFLTHFSSIFYTLFKFFDTLFKYCTQM